MAVVISDQAIYEITQIVKSEGRDIKMQLEEWIIKYIWTAQEEIKLHIPLTPLIQTVRTTHG